VTSAARHRQMSSSSCGGGVFLPPSPPDSIPCSPRRSNVGSVPRRSGVPPRRSHPCADRRATTGAAMMQVTTASATDSDHIDVPLTPVTRRPRLTHPGCTTIKYNRRTNPELERRRTHFCHFAGIGATTCFFATYYVRRHVDVKLHIHRIGGLYCTHACVLKSYCIKRI